MIGSKYDYDKKGEYFLKRHILIQNEKIKRETSRRILMHKFIFVNILLPTPNQKVTQYAYNAIQKIQTWTFSCHLSATSNDIDHPGDRGQVCQTKVININTRTTGITDVASKKVATRKSTNLLEKETRCWHRPKRRTVAFFG